MIVVSDTTALSTLYLIDHIDWLGELFGQVLIPEAVYDELADLEDSGHDIHVFRETSWLTVRSIQNQELASQLRRDLDKGESEAIVLALEMQADYLLIDERKGSHMADEMGVPTIGLLRVILELKHRNIIPLVKPVLDKIRQTGGFWMSSQLYERVLQAANEDLA